MFSSGFVLCLYIIVLVFYLNHISISDLILGEAGRPSSVWAFFKYYVLCLAIVDFGGVVFF